MAGNWARLTTLGNEYLSKHIEIYTKRKFPPEIRDWFADWFEENNWNFDVKTPENIQHANDLLLTLLNKIEQRLSLPQLDLMKQMSLHSIKKNFTQEFGERPQVFVATVRDILAEEQQLLNQALNVHPNHMPGQQPVVTSDCDYVVIPPPQDQQQQQPPPQPENTKIQIEKNLANLRTSVLEIDTVIKQYRNNQEDFVLQYQGVQKIDSDIQNVTNQPKTGQREIQLKTLTKEKMETEKMLKQKADYLVDHRGNILNKLCDIENMIRISGTSVMEELLGWKVMLQKSLSGAPKPESLDEIQRWFENLTDILWDFYALASQFKLLFEVLPITKSSDDRGRIENLLKAIVASLTTLIMQSFVVDKQPPQVLKTQTKFQASVSLLYGAKLNLQMNCPEVVVSILSERQCKDLVQGKKLEDIGNCGEILNGNCVMEHNKERTVLQADFKNLQLRKIQRQDRKGQESVLEAKSALVFSAKLNISGDLLPVVVMSVPVVVVVHGNQGPNSEATIIWDNMFSQPDREPFDVPDAVSWAEMRLALNAKWMMINEHELHRDHLMFLKEKLFQSIELDVDGSTPKVPWSAFNKEPLKGRTFTFWEWFHGCIDIVKKHLKDHWKYNCIEFTSKQKAHMKLLERPAGTFLIRFSEGELGAVTIAWCTENNGRKEILMLQPWSSRDFSIRGLADRIFDLPELTYLFPDIPKELAFGPFRTPDVPQASGGCGYVLSGIMTRIHLGNSDSASDCGDTAMDDGYSQNDWSKIILDNNNAPLDFPLTGQ